MLYQTGKHICVLGCEAGGGCCVHVALSGREQALCPPCARVCCCVRAAELPRVQRLVLFTFSLLLTLGTSSLLLNFSTRQRSELLSYYSAPHSHVRRLSPGAPQLVRAGSLAKSRSNAVWRSCLRGLPQRRWQAYALLRHCLSPYTRHGPPGFLSESPCWDSAGAQWVLL